MKNLNIFLVVAIAATSILSSCNSNNPKTPQLKNENDSISYALGLTQGSSIKSYYIQGDSISQDSINKKINSLLKGINDGMKKVKTDNAELTTLAENIGNSLREQKNTGLLGDTNLIVNMKLIKQGLINGLYKSNIQMTPEEAQNYLNTTMQKLNEIKLETQYGANKNTGKLFLQENAKKEGIITTESGLQYEVITLGKGEKPTETSRVKVHYHGTLIDGSVFDSSVERGEPAVFGVNQVIKGWTEALQLMPVGSKFKLYIPYDLAYGSQNAGSIEPFSTLIFDVELISIEK